MKIIIVIATLFISSISTATYECLPNEECASADNQIEATAVDENGLAQASKSCCTAASGRLPKSHSALTNANKPSIDSPGGDQTR